MDLNRKKAFLQADNEMTYLNGFDKIPEGAYVKISIQDELIYIVTTNTILLNSDYYYGKVHNHTIKNTDLYCILRERFNNNPIEFVESNGIYYTYIISNKNQLRSVNHSRLLYKITDSYLYNKYNNYINKTDKINFLFLKEKNDLHRSSCGFTVSEFHYIVFLSPIFSMYTYEMSEYNNCLYTIYNIHDVEHIIFTIYNMLLLNSNNEIKSIYASILSRLEESLSLDYNYLAIYNTNL